MPIFKFKKKTLKSIPFLQIQAKTTRNVCKKVQRVRVKDNYVNSMTRAK